MVKEGTQEVSVFGFWLGTMSLLGLCAVAAGGRRRAWAHGGGCHGGGHRGWHHHEWRSRHGHGEAGPEQRERRRAGMSAAVTEIVKRRLRVDEEQEPYVDHAAKDVRETWKTFHGELHAARAELAGAFRGETVDDAAVDAIFQRLDAAFKTARREAVSAAKQVHSVLEPEQRAAAADLLSRDLGEGWVL